MTSEILPIISKLPQFPEYLILVSLFEHATNSSEIRSHLLQGNVDYEYAFIDPATIYSLDQLFAAIYRAINDAEAGFLRTRNIHSEIVFCLSPNNNIMDGLRRFGISDSSKSILAVKVIKGSTSDDTADESNKNLYQPYLGFLITNVEGTQARVSNLSIQKLTDLKVIKKNYKLQAALSNPEQINSAIISSISLRGS